LVQSHAVPKPDGSLSAVVVSGGKQYRVAPGDRILVDRITAEPGSSLKLGRVLLFTDGKEIKIGAPAIDGVDVEVKVLAHRRGPRIESIRYKSKKRVRVHHGGRADLTALEIIAVGGITAEPRNEAATTVKPAGKAKAPAKAKAVAAPKAEAAPDHTTETAEAPAKRAPRRARTTKAKEETE
jgi:large subunit ribosomal protein L21